MPVVQKAATRYKFRGRLDPIGFERHLTFTTQEPQRNLAAVVDHLWILRSNGGRGRYESPEVMHQPFVDMFISTHGSGVQGTFRGKRVYIADGDLRILGVRFRPGAFHAFWPGKMCALADQTPKLPTILPWADEQFINDVLAAADYQAQQLITDRLLANLPSPDPTVRIISEIIAAIESDSNLFTVQAVAKEFNRSERWLQQTCREYLGVEPKWLLKRHRLLLAAEEIRKMSRPDWAGIAYDLGYSSQQHFITDFRKVLGMTPVQYKKQMMSSRA